MHGATFWGRLAFGRGRAAIRWRAGCVRAARFGAFRRGGGGVALPCHGRGLRYVAACVRARLHVGLAHEVERAALGLEVGLGEVLAHDAQA